ncbi:MAG: hypothetical protein IJX20_03950 [Alphaproteobacteria bacterium]|nr:hypothetical protein [Alphaproteobacteria bacterium]
MFEWLAKMMLKTPVMSSGCACCEGKRQRLEKMRQEIEKGETAVSPYDDYVGMSFCSGSYSAHLKPKDFD